jgi:hypothetical protein
MGKVTRVADHLGSSFFGVRGMFNDDHLTRSYSCRSASD